MTLMRKTSYWYHDPDEAIHVMMELEKKLIPYIELILGKTPTKMLLLHFKGYSDMNICLLYEHGHQIILDKIEAREILTMMNIWKMQITKM